MTHAPRPHVIHPTVTEPEETQDQPPPERMPMGSPLTGLTPIRPEAIDPDATKVVRRLVRYGYEAFLVGGCVRDLLLGRQPKDFDVATSATPNEIKKLFRNSRIIGRRFRLAHIFFGAKIIETSTFRAPPLPQPEAEAEDLIIRRDNEFGTAREDALRRDFTINGLFLDLPNELVLDHVGGLADLQRRRVRTIGDPRVRIPEDPVRIMRAVKFAARLDFELDPATEAAMVEYRGMIAQCSVARVLEEIYRLLGSGHAAPALRLCHRTGVLAVLLPEVQAVVGPPPDARAQQPVAPVQDRSGVPRDAGDAESPEALARDAGPDPALSRSRDPTPEDLATIQAATEQLVVDLTGPDPRARELAGQLTWGHLEAVDRAVKAGAAQDPPTGPTHAFLLAGSVIGLARHQLGPETPIRESMASLEQLVKVLGGRLRVSRRDRERLKQLLVALRRMVHQGKRRRPTALMQRDYFPEAWQLFELSCAVTGEHQEALEHWRQLMGRSAKGKGRRGRRRGRRGRRRRKPSTD